MPPISYQLHCSPHFHCGNTGSNPVGDANKTKGIENRPKVINRSAFARFKDLAFYPPRQPLKEQGILEFTFAMNPAFPPCLLEIDYLGFGLSALSLCNFISLRPETSLFLQSALFLQRCLSSSF